MTWKKTEGGFIESGDWLVGPRPDADTLALAFLALKAGGYLDKIFHQSEGNIQEWLAWLTDPKLYVPGVWLKNSEGNYAFKGMGFVNFPHCIPGVYKAEVGFTFIPDPEVTVFRRVALIKAIITYTFDQTPIDCMLGTTPEPNAAAVAVIRRTGMRVFGPIPSYCSWHGKPCAAFISQADRESWPYHME